MDSRPLGQSERAGADLGRLALVLVGVAAPLSVLALIATQGVPVPVWDQWELVPLLEKFRGGVLAFDDLWKQHNEHRLVAPLALMVALAALSGWNIYLELAASFLFACGTLALLASLLRATFEGQVPRWLLAAFSLVVFSLSQHENWLWGWQLQWFMVAFGSVLAIWALQRWPGQARGVLVAALGALLASLSLSSGLLVWVAALALLARSHGPRWLLCWCGAALAVFAAFFAGFETPPGHPSRSAFLATPLEFLRYVATYLGLPLGACDPVLAPLAGVTTVLALAVALTAAVRRDRGAFSRFLPWLTLAFFALLSAAATGVGRVGFGAQQALSSRYATLANLLLLATLVACALAWDHPGRATASRRSRTLVVALATLAVSAHAATCWISTNLAVMRSAALAEARAEWLAYPRTSLDAFGVLYPIEHVSLIRERSGTLRDLGYLLPPEPDATRPRRGMRRRGEAAEPAPQPAAPPAKQ